jgi:hypothetical protein
MSDVLQTLIEAIRGRVAEDRAPAVLCEDTFGNETALALHSMGANFQPYAITLEDASTDKVLTIADRLDRRLKLITVVPRNMGADFVHLAVHHRCFTKAEFALGYVVMHASEAIDETEVWLSLPQSSPDHRGWRTAKRIAGHYGKTLINPFHDLDPSVDVDSMMRVAEAATGTT